MSGDHVNELPQSFILLLADMLERQWQREHQIKAGDVKAS